MNGSEIMTIVYNDIDFDKVHFVLCSSDTLPTTVNYFPTAYIVNTDPSYKSGEHWVAFYFESNSSIPEYFDSYGLPPTVLSFYDILPHIYKCLDVALQSLFSTVCGYYCLYYLKSRSMGQSMEEAISIFDNNRHNNDKIIVQYFNKNFKKFDSEINVDLNRDQVCTSPYLCKHSFI